MKTAAAFRILVGTIMRAPDFIRLAVPCSALLLSAGTPSMAQIATVPSFVAAPIASGAFSAAAPVLGPSLTIAAPLFAAAPPVAPAPVPARALERAPAAEILFLRDFRSEALDNSRTIAVYLPPGYDSSNARYPVLYMQDGQNVFDAPAAHGGEEWGIDATADRLIRSGELPPFIVVAVYNTDDRIGEYTPVPDAQYGGGRSGLYAKFLIDELKPYIDAHLRTLPDAEHTGLMGSSLGGLLSLDLGLSRPDVFSRIGALSPSLWWAGGELTGRLQSSPAAVARPRVWLDMGTREGDSPDKRVEETRTMGRVLEARGWREGDDLAVGVIDGASHDERSWRARAADVLKFLFPVAPRP